MDSALGSGDFATAEVIVVPHFTGVLWNRAHETYEAQIIANGRTNNLGPFREASSAARAHDIYAIRCGLAHVVNFPADLEEMRSVARYGFTDIPTRGVLTRYENQISLAKCGRFGSNTGSPDAECYHMRLAR